MVVGAPGVDAFVVALTSDALPAFVPVRSWAYGPCMGLGEPLF
jgi:Asp/Glu/hydantoin racemase